MSQPARKGVLALIPARAGSKGIVGKNIAPLAGKPLLAWTILAAKEVAGLDRICVSTDGDDIGETALTWALSDDTATPKSAVLHHLEELEAKDGFRPKYLVLLQPTSPLRTGADIQACLDIVKDGNRDSCATFCSAATNPARAWRLDDAGDPMPWQADVDPWRMRQALEPAYELNGAVYIVDVEKFVADAGQSFLVGNCGAVIMPSNRSVDIDTPLDLIIASALMAQNMASPTA
jgi:CMP-N,N'-diacetyllegionaminic acid synthase